MAIPWLRRMYPSPKAASNLGTNVLTDYSVSGALCLATGYKVVPRDGTRKVYTPRFPSPEQLTGCLVRTNPLLSPAMARIRAHRLIEMEEDGNFARAWEILDNTLHYGGNGQWLY